MPKYTIKYLDGSGVTTTVDCPAIDVESAVIDDVVSGDWPEDSTTWVDVEVTGPDYQNRKTVQIDPTEPRCIKGMLHDWSCTIIGQGSSGLGVKTAEDCSQCHTRRIIDNARRKDTGESGFLVISYELPLA